MFQMTLTLPELPDKGGLWKTVLPRFQKEAGEMLVEAVRAHLGTSDIYTLTEAYSAAKVAGKTNPKMERIEGKSGDQPLILSGEMYWGVEANPGPDGTIILSVNPTAGVGEDGFDVAEYWESGEGSGRGFDGVHYLEKGLADVEDKLADLLGTIIAEEMLLEFS